VSRRRKRRRSAAEPKLEAVGSSAWFGAVLAGPYADPTRACCLNVPCLLE
jgi:hypothetical protein